MASIATNSVAKMTGNPDMTTPSPKVPLLDMTESANAVTEQYADRFNGPMNKENFKNAVNDLDLKLHEQLGYASNQADGIALIIDSAGFAATTNARKVAVRLGDTNTPKLKTMGNGKMKSTIVRMEGAKEYVHIFFHDPNSIIIVTRNTISCMSANGGSFSMVSGKLKEVMEGFTPNKKIYACAVARNKRGYGNLSAIISSGVL